MPDDVHINDRSDQAIQAIREGMVNGLEDVVDKILEKAKRKVPVRTGNLLRSILRDPPQITRDSVSIKFGAFTDYASSVEFGTGIHSEHPQATKQRIYPKERKALAWTDPGVPRPPGDDAEAWRELRAEGKATVVSSIEGQEPQPYMRPSIREVSESGQGARLMAEELVKAIAKRLPRTD